MVKKIAREKFDESHLPSTRYTHEKKTRKKKGLSLAQEEESIELKANTGGTTIFTANPVVNSLQQSR
jgi:hypothetical protein